MARTKQTARKSTGGRTPPVSYLPTEKIINTSFLTSAAQLPASETRASPFQRKGRHLALPLVIRGYCIPAVVDTGSDIDAIGLDLVGHLFLQGTRIAQRCKKVRLGDGSVLHAIGKVSVRCSFDRGDEAQFRRTFFVFPKLSNRVELIIGRRFLFQTQTLTKHQDRLEELPHASTTTPEVMSMAIPKRRFACYIDSTLVLANADTGSEINLIKEDYAIERGFTVIPVTKEEKYAQLPGDRLAIITGKTMARLDTLHAAPPASVSREPTSKVGAHCSMESSTMSSVNPQEPTRLTTFYILPSLLCNVLLSQQLLDSINAFTTHSNSFVEFTTTEREVEDLAHIKWLNALDRKLMGKLIKSATWPPASVRAVSDAPPQPNLDAIATFLGEPLDRLNLATDSDYDVALHIRKDEEAVRREASAATLHALKQAVPESIDPNSSDSDTAAVHKAEQMERQAQRDYTRDRKRCDDAWEAWRSWLQSAQEQSQRRLA